MFDWARSDICDHHNHNQCLKFNHKTMDLKYHHTIIIISITINIVIIVLIIGIVISKGGIKKIFILVLKATAAAAVGKMELARTHGTEIPEGWALDK